jgi:hypothetical protein
MIQALLARVESTPDEKCAVMKVVVRPKVNTPKFSG